MLGEGSILIARWNGMLLPNGRNSMSPHSVSMRIPGTGDNLFLTLHAGIPTAIDELWLKSPQLNSIAVQGSDRLDPGKVALWYADEVPSPVLPDVTGLRSDMAESLRQVIHGALTKEEEILGPLSYRPGKESTLSTPFVIDHYIPFLQRVIEEEPKFQNRKEVISRARETLALWKERV